jgi:beta-N-acetylhexosaminidase
MKLKFILIILAAGLMYSCSEDPSRPEPVTASLDKKIGQMLCIGFRGMEVGPGQQIVQDVYNGRVGGVVLFDKDVALGYTPRNIESPAQVKSLVNTLKTYAEAPLFVCVDMEGGKVLRLKPEYGFPDAASPQHIGSIDRPDTTIIWADGIAKTLQQMGFTVNFAPVVDLNVNPDNPVIGKLGRSFSADPLVVTRNAELFADAHNQRGIYTTLKHFPGHGSSTSDSHKGFVDVTNTWSEIELEPYRRLIDRGSADFVMTAHIFNSNLDPEYPATLSHDIITGLLRNELEFGGIVFSDDMQMKAITEHYGLETAIEKSINAGVDVLVFGNNLEYDPGIATKVIDIVKKLVAEGKISEDRIARSYNRIMAYKNRLREDYIAEN